MNNVIVYTNVLVEKLSVENGYKNVYEKKMSYAALFINHGVDYEEMEQGVGQYSTFVVRKENGDVENVPVEMCKLTGPL